MNTIPQQLVAVDVRLPLTTLLLLLAVGLVLVALAVKRRKQG